MLGLARLQRVPLKARSASGWGVTTIALLAMALTTHAATPAAAADVVRNDSFSCGVPANVAWSSRPANVFSVALAQPTPVRIVMLGSSSTAGTGTSKGGISFGRQMERDLKKMFGKDKIVVSNAGRGGETAARMFARLNNDVLKRNPHLVIWQTGVNDALRRVDPIKFENLLRDGIRILHERKIDVVLVDMQDFPRAARVKRYRDYLTIMDRVAKSEGVPLLHRFRIMNYLARSHKGGLSTLLAADQFHMNDLGHKCIGEILADGLRNLGGARPVNKPVSNTVE